MTNERKTVSKTQWLEARAELMVKEKALMKQTDAVAAERRALPWVRVDKKYVFENASGPVTLDELFADKSQLVIQHFMYGSDWDAGCPSCSFWADHADAVRPHLGARDVSHAVVSSGPVAKLHAFAERMGWKFNWVSSASNDFNSDYRVTFTKDELESGELIYNFGTAKPHGEEAHGISVFFKDEEGTIFHTYSTFGRGVEPLNGTYQYLNIVPKGRDEDGLPYPMGWVRRHDEYEA